MTGWAVAGWAVAGWAAMVAGLCWAGPAAGWVATVADRGDAGRVATGREATGRRATATAPAERAPGRVATAADWVATAADWVATAADWVATAAHWAATMAGRTPRLGSSPLKMVAGTWLASASSPKPGTWTHYVQLDHNQWPDRAARLHTGPHRPEGGD